MRPKIAIGLLAVAAILVWVGMAGAQTAPGEPDKIKAMLLRPAGWKAEWAFPGADKGESEVVFEGRGDKVVATTLGTTRSGPAHCEGTVAISSDTVKYNSCYDSITLRFDPNDQDYPLKGKSERGYEYKLRAK